MKKHAIIPIFIPHEGCPHACVFCNQRVITTRSEAPSKEDVIKTIETWLTTLADVPTVEIAFYGGSFTAIPKEMQRRYLAIAKEYKDAKRIDSIHLSTRPDAIDEDEVLLLASYGVDIVELGVQSFDPEVLRRSERGHDAAIVEKSVTLLKRHGFQVGIQLMIGLPGDSMESCLLSAEETVRLKPDIARLYPTIVLPATKLEMQLNDGTYCPPTEEEMVARTAAMYRIITGAGIRIIRVGLKSNDLVGASSTFHPAFRQLVEGQIAREDIEAQLSNTEGSAIACANGGSFSNLIGNGGRNKRYFQKTYPNLTLRFQVDDSLPRGVYLVKI